MHTQLREMLPTASRTQLHRNLRTSLIAFTLIGCALPGYAQSTVPEIGERVDTSSDVLKMDEMVVTAVSRPDKSKLTSSVSVSSLALERLDILSPRSTAELFRSVPGIRIESTSGEGNANMTVRGLPLSGGGSLYVQVQEDGLPVVEYGDIQFGTSDTFFRGDSTIANIESVRGGSAATFASNSPGGVINLISKTGSYAGGSASYTRGLDFNSSKTEFEYGTPVTTDLRFHVGGFYRTGEGARKTGLDSSGGQLKFNVTKDFKGGYVRIYAKFLDDAAPTYLPAPTKVSGNGSYTSLPDYDVKKGSMYSSYLTTNAAIDGNGNPVYIPMAGIHSKVTSLGAEVQVTPGEDLTITDRFRVSSQSAQWSAPFPAVVESGSAVLADTAINGGPGATLWYATGPRIGQSITDLTKNFLVVHMFNTRVRDMGWSGNDAKINKFIRFADGSKLDLTGGYYKSRQKIAMDWVWTSYLQEARGENAALVDVVSATGAKLTDKGLLAYGPIEWGNFARGYNLAYDTDAPYANISYQQKKLSLDAGLRFDSVKARGVIAGANVTGKDVDGNGTISRPETMVPVLDWAHANSIRYSLGYTSYTVGANYALSKDLAVFARHSFGGRAGADRTATTPFINAAGDKVDAKGVYNDVKQTEVGVKYRTTKWVPGQLSFNSTVFLAKTREPGSFEATSLKVLSGSYRSYGVEFEGAYAYAGFELRGNATYTHAREQSKGYVPRRQAEWIYTIEPSYTVSKFRFGLSLVGTTEAHFQNPANGANYTAADLVMPAYRYVNGMIAYRITKDLTISLNVNNLFDTTGFTEGEEGTAPSNMIIRARTIPGRTISASLRYTF